MNQKLNILFFDVLYLDTLEYSREVIKIGNLYGKKHAEMERTHPNRYTVIEEYVPLQDIPLSDDITNTVNTDNLPQINSVYHVENKPLDNPILGKDSNEELMLDLFGEPTGSTHDKMDTETPPKQTPLALPAPASATKQSLPEFSKEYKDSLQANAENTADTNLDNIELPDISQDKELKTFLDEMDKKAKAATTPATSYYSGYSGYGGYGTGYGSSYGGGYGSSYGNVYSGYNNRHGEYDGYKSTNYSNYGNYDYYNEKRNWRNRRDDDDWYTDKKAKTDDIKVKFSDETEVKLDPVEEKTEDNIVDIKDLNELKNLLVTKFGTSVKLFTRTIKMIGEVKTMQLELKKMQANFAQEIITVKRELTIMSSQIDYITRSMRFIKDRSNNDTDDDIKACYYGADYSDDDDGYESPDDITKKSKFDNRVPDLR